MQVASNSNALHHVMLADAVPRYACHAMLCQTMQCYVMLFPAGYGMMFAAFRGGMQPHAVVVRQVDLLTIAAAAHSCSDKMYACASDSLLLARGWCSIAPSPER